MLYEVRSRFLAVLGELTRYLVYILKNKKKTKNIRGRLQVMCRQGLNTVIPHYNEVSGTATKDSL